MNLAPYRPKSLDELNQAYDKAKEAQRASKPQAAPVQPQQPAPQQPQAPQTPRPSIADAVRAREGTQAISGAVDDFIKNFSAKEPAPQSAYAHAKESTEAKETQAKQEIARETQQAFDDVLAFPDIQTTAPEPPAYQRYTHDEAPIKEGDLSGLMDEYIAVMTDQNGEDDNRHSFLRRRKNRRKDKLPQHSDSEPAAELFDLPDPTPAVPQPPVVPYTPPVETPVPPVTAPVVPPVAPPVELPFEEPVVPVEIPAEEPVVPVEVPFEEPVAPVEVPFEEPVAPVEVPFEEPVAPVEVPFEEPVVPVEVPFEEPVAPVETPAEAPAAPVVPQMPTYTPYHSPLETQRKEMDAVPPVRTEKKPKRKINMEPEPVFDPRRLFDDLDDDEPVQEPQPVVETPAPFDVPAEEPLPVTPEPQPEPEPQPQPMPEPEPVKPPQEFEDIVSYSTESENDRFTPIPEEPLVEPTDVPQAPEDAPADDDDIDYDDYAATELQQEVVIRPSKVKVFFKVIVTLLLIVSLLATACVGLIRLVLNVNTGKSAFGDYYFFAVSNDYANVGIRSGDLILAQRKLPVGAGETAVYVDPNTRSFSFGKNDASTGNNSAYNLSGIAVLEENVLGVVIKTVPQGGTLVRNVLNDFYTYLGACVGAFLLLLLIRVIFLRKKRT